MKLNIAGLLFFFLLISFPSQGSLESADTFEPGEHCVAYKTKKRLFLVHKVTVIGKNCDISTEVIPKVGNKFSVELSAPIQSFQSGEIERDRDVARILKHDVSRELEFKSAALTKQEWKDRFSEEKFELKGVLVIGKEEFPITAKVQILRTDKGVEILGRVPAHFQDFKIKPPKMAAGLAAKVSEDLELVFRIQPEQTLGSSSLMDL